jgi:hypothetical protein
MPDRKVWFGAGLGARNGADVARAAESARLVAHFIYRLIHAGPAVVTRAGKALALTSAATSVI